MPGADAIARRLLPILPLLVSMAVHFVLVSFYQISVNTLIVQPDGQALQTVNWMPALTFSHTILFLVGLWALLDKESVEAVISYIVVIAFTILLDIVQLGLDFPTFQREFGGGNFTSARTWQFSAACVIFNLLFKPLSIVLACIVLFVRAGGTLGSFTSFVPRRDSYAAVNGSNEGGPEEDEHPPPQ